MRGEKESKQLLLACPRELSALTQAAGFSPNRVENLPLSEDRTVSPADRTAPTCEHCADSPRPLFDSPFHRTANHSSGSIRPDDPVGIAFLFNAPSPSPRHPQPSGVMHASRGANGPTATDDTHDVPGGMSAAASSERRTGHTEGGQTGGDVHSVAEKMARSTAADRPPPHADRRPPRSSPSRRTRRSPLLACSPSRRE